MSSPENSFDTKAVLITGGARRIGAAIARVLHAAGLDVIIHYRHSADAALALQEELHEHRPGSVRLCQADLTNPGACQTLTQCAHQAFGRLDALINNASAFYPTPVDKATEAQWDDLFAINLKAPFFLAQACAPMLAMHNGAIINLADIYAKRPLAQHPIYSAAKAGLISLTRSLARDLGRILESTPSRQALYFGPKQGYPMKMRMRSCNVHRCDDWVALKISHVPCVSCSRMHPLSPAR